MSDDGKAIHGSGELLLVRHTEISAQYHGVCYGASDVPLSDGGQDHARELAVKLADEKPGLVVHSGLSRARFLADDVARLAGADSVCDARLREMNFGAWELRRNSSQSARRGGC